MADEKAREPSGNMVGKPFRRVDGVSKVTGRTLFADDLNFPRQVHMKLVRSTVPHAKIKRIDTSIAENMPGVVGILTGKEMPETFGILPVSQDEHALCLDVVRFVGDPVVAVAALTEDEATEAALAIKVDYEPLTTVSSVEEAIKTPEPRIHDYGDEGNIHKKIAFDFGGTEEAFEDADEVFEDVLFFEGNTHLPMEQHATLAVPEGTGKVAIYSSTQTPHYLHRSATKVLGIPATHVRVIACPNGGGFGGKVIRLITRFVPRRCLLNSGGR